MISEDFGGGFLGRLSGFETVSQTKRSQAFFSVGVATPQRRAAFSPAASP